MSDLTLGIEGGSTKTRWVVVDEKGKIQRQGIAGPGNMQHLSEEQASALLAKIASEAGPGITGIGACLPFIDKMKAGNKEALRVLWPEAKKITYAGDQIAAYLSAFGHHQEGIVVIAGTGSMAYGRKDGKYELAGGWGNIFSDEGSGYDIGRRGLMAVFSHYDRMTEVLPLGAAFLKAKGCKTLWDLQPMIMGNASKDIAFFAPLVFDAAEAGDPVCKKIIANGAKELAHRAAWASKHLGIEKPNVALTGSLFEKRPAYVALFENALKKELRGAVGKVFMNETPPALGAALLVADFPLPHQQNQGKFADVDFGKKRATAAIPSEQDLIWARHGVPLAEHLK